MKKTLLFLTILIGGLTATFAAPANLNLRSPKAGDALRWGKTITIKWDTVDSQNNSTRGSVFQFRYATSENGPWLPLPIKGGQFKDVQKDTAKAQGSTTTVFPKGEGMWLKMQLKSDSNNVFAVTGPFSVSAPQPVVADSTLGGSLTHTITLDPNKRYMLDKVLYVDNGATLRIPAGTIIFGDPANVSAIVINRGGKIYAKGEANRPIILTSPFGAGSRDRGDWGGLLIMGFAQTNLGEAAVEGGIADQSGSKKNGWYGTWNGSNDDHDSSGVLQYVRIEFAGIAESPDNELNGLTMGAVGDRTVIDHVQVSYGGDDSFEWFGGSVNAKYLIAYNGIDDDFDTDNGFRGKVQFGISKRFSGIADQSSSEAFESDNDASASENKPFTSPIFANMTVIGPISDTSMTPGVGPGYFNSKYLAAAQIRRNSRMSLVNSVILGWPAGVELTNNNTVRAASMDSIYVRNNDFYGVRGSKWFYFGSGTQTTSGVDANWLSTSAYGNRFVNKSGDVGAIAGLTLAFPNEADGDALQTFNPLPNGEATYMNNADWTPGTSVNLGDDFFEKVSYRGAFGTQRWDAGWTEYDPVNADYATKNFFETPRVIDFGITAAPLPVSSSSVVSFELPEATNLTIRLFDATGSIASTFKNGEFFAEGLHSFRFDASSLKTGVYYLQIVSDKGVATMTLPVVK